MSTKLRQPKFPDGFMCANCGRSIEQHCREHLIPCCPGKCRIEREALRADLERFSRGRPRLSTRIRLALLRLVG